MTFELREMSSPFKLAVTYDLVEPILLKVPPWQIISPSLNFCPPEVDRIAGPEQIIVSNVYVGKYRPDSLGVKFRHV
jgi:hypothetical protein